MNYYNPYFMYTPVSGLAKGGLFSSLKGGLSLSTIMNGTQRTLGIINQAIPLIKQAAPMFKNAKTMFQVMNEFKKMDTPETASTTKESEVKTEEYSSGPQFFI